MELQEVEIDEPQLCSGKEKYLYNQSSFHEINRNKVDRVVKLLFITKKNKASLIAGIKEGRLLIPYSAPFGIFEVSEKGICIEELDSIIQLLEDYAKKHGLKEIFFRMPPTFYDESFLSKVQNVLFRTGYIPKIYDLNYQYYLEDFEHYENNLKRNAKKNWKTACKQCWSFIRCETEEEKRCAYEVIAANRREKGYPLRMTWTQVKETMAIAEHVCFLLRMEHVDVAAAIVFGVTSQIAQVVYWGDIAGYQDLRPMNYLSYKVFEYYYENGWKVLDIGPSTENGIPNYGLCNFKEGLGCKISTKLTFVKSLQIGEKYAGL